MARSQDSFNKKEKEKNRKLKREEKERKKEERKANSRGGGLDNMIAYVDEYGNFSSTPPDPRNKDRVIAHNIEISVPKREEREENPVRTGVVTYFDTNKGYGFIVDLETEERVFSHIQGHLETIRENDRVTFMINMSPKGPQAVEVRVVR